MAMGGTTELAKTHTSFPDVLGDEEKEGAKSIIRVSLNKRGKELRNDWQQKLTSG